MLQEGNNYCCSENSIIMKSTQMELEKVVMLKVDEALAGVRLLLKQMDEAVEADG